MKQLTQLQRDFNLFNEFANLERTCIFLYLNYDFRYNAELSTIEVKQKPDRLIKCATNIRDNFNPLNKYDVCTWILYLKTQDIQISSNIVWKILQWDIVGYGKPINRAIPNRFKLKRL